MSQEKRATPIIRASIAQVQQFSDGAPNTIGSSDFDNLFSTQRLNPGSDSIALLDEAGNLNIRQNQHPTVTKL